MYNFLLMLILSVALISCEGNQTSTPTNAKRNSDDNTNNDSSSSSSSGSKFTSRSSGRGGGRTSHWIDSVTFVRIDAGEFTMGSSRTETTLRRDNEGPKQVNITRDFEIMEAEVTQKQWFNVKGNNPSFHKTDTYCGNHEIIDEIAMCPLHPVENVSWSKVQDYITELNNSLSLSGCNGTPNSSRGCYRLPTEAEWEYAVRGGGSATYSTYSFGETVLEDLDDVSDLGNYAWWKNNSDNQLKEVKTKNPVRGLYDMHGNVWEWVQDKYQDTLKGGDDPLRTGSGKNYMYRGGSYGNGPQALRSTHRTRPNNIEAKKTVGFRLVRTL